MKKPPFLSKIKEAGGRCLLIGGAVIDHINGLPVKDWDIEVYGLSYDTLLSIMKDYGEPNIVGKSFGVLKIRIDGIDYDLSIPRKENRIGTSHRDFAIELIPELSPEEAAIRRDLTINSMYIDLHTLELIDPFNGLDDFKKGILRATNKQTFREDPLRVLRIMQLLPRKAKSVHPDTVNLCKSMVDEFPTISKERVFEEWRKLLLQSNKPSLGLNFLRESLWIKWFPELERLIECPQNPEYHPEGDVWTHTLLAVDYATELRNNLPEKWQLAYMFGILLHDVGKPDTTDPETLTAYGHAVQGAKLAENFMKRITEDRELIKKVVEVVRLHMRPGSLYRNNASEAGWKRLHNKMRLDVLAMISRADKMASSLNKMDYEHEPSEVALENFQKFGEKRISPVLMGRHLIAAGYTPGREFSLMLERAYEYQIETGCEDVEVLLSVATEKKNETLKR